MSGSKARPLGPASSPVLWASLPCGFLDDPRASISSLSHETKKRYGTDVKNATIAPWPKLPLLLSVMVYTSEFIRATQERMVNYLMLQLPKHTPGALPVRASTTVLSEGWPRRQKSETRSSLHTKKAFLEGEGSECTLQNPASFHPQRSLREGAPSPKAREKVIQEITKVHGTVGLR